MAIKIIFEANELRNNEESFISLGNLHFQLSPYNNEAIEIDCHKLRWFDAHLSGPLRTIIYHSAFKNNRHSLINLREDIRDILSKNGFLKKKLSDRFKTTMPMKDFDLSEQTEFAAYAKKNLHRPELPKMTDQLQHKFHEGIDEIFANCSLHSDSPVQIVASGQFYPRKNLLSMSITDGGIGVIGSIKKANIPIKSHSRAIDWAMQKNNTSRIGDIPGGLGLAVLREFVSKNNGQLLVASKGGFWWQDKDGVHTSTLDWEFPGTSVILEINTADKKSYDLKSPVTANDIW